MKYLLICILLVTPVFAKNGKKLYRKCIACHGKTGMGRGVYPKLAGQHTKYLTKQLKDIKSKKRKVPEMYNSVKKLSDKDIKEISKYLNSLSGCK